MADVIHDAVDYVPPLVVEEEEVQEEARITEAQI